MLVLGIRSLLRLWLRLRLRARRLRLEQLRLRLRSCHLRLKWLHLRDLAELADLAGLFGTAALASAGSGLVESESGVGAAVLLVLILS
jgi:hypothetical protein